MQNQISLLVCDLGSNLGWCRCNCVLRPGLLIKAVDHGTIYLDALTNDLMRREYNEIYSRRRYRMIVYEEVVRKLIASSRFDGFVVEDVFCNPQRVDAFRALTLYMEVFERIVNTEYGKRLYTIPPTSIKRHINGYGHSDKSMVQNAILGNKQINVKRPEEATHHEFDAIAAAWAFAQEYLYAIT